jgi:hypothetical protein
MKKWRVEASVKNESEAMHKNIWRLVLLGASERMFISKV